MNELQKINKVEKDVLQYINDAESVSIIESAFRELRAAGITENQLKNWERIYNSQKSEIHTRDEVIKSLRVYINFLEKELENARAMQDE